MTTDQLLAMAEAAEGECDRCGLRPTLVDPESGRLVLIDARVTEDENGRYTVRCEGC